MRSCFRMSLVLSLSQQTASHLKVKLRRLNADSDEETRILLCGLNDGAPALSGGV